VGPTVEPDPDNAGGGKLLGSTGHPDVSGMAFVFAPRLSLFSGSGLSFSFTALPICSPIH
jgi:hypothetical protein